MDLELGVAVEAHDRRTRFARGRPGNFELAIQAVHAARLSLLGPNAGRERAHIRADHIHGRTPTVYAERDAGLFYRDAYPRVTRARDPGRVRGRSRGGDDRGARAGRRRGDHRCARDGNQRTEESTVRSVAGVSIGDTMEVDTLDMVRERLNTTGPVRGRQRLVGAAQDRRAREHLGQGQVPLGAGPDRLVVGQQQVARPAVRARQPVGRGKQLLLGGRIATVDSGVALGYRDPSLFGSWIYWQLQGNFQRQNIPEYLPGDEGADRDRSDRRCSSPTRSSRRSASPGGGG